MTESAATTAPLPRFALGEGTAAFDAAVEQARSEDWATRLFDRDTTLWSTDPRVQEAIAQRLGWLDAPEEFASRTAGLEGFGDAISELGVATVVLGGMGGSSLAPDVLRRTFGSTEGYPELRILDSTDPEFVAAALDDLDPLATLFIFASKSGTTVEPNMFLADAWARAEVAVRHDGGRRGTHAGELFVAVTDGVEDVAGRAARLRQLAGRAADVRPLHSIPHVDDMREVFLNPPDIGGRYSALTYFGLVPASLLGLDLDALLGSAISMVGACREPDAAVNPGVSLGLAIGTLAKSGRDKLTFLVDDEIESLGAWLEQLIAESTGKRGIGIVPVDSEPLGAVEAYGPDRAFVRIALDGGTAGGREELAGALEAAGHPLIRIDMSDPIDLGGEFVRWEVATAIAGAVLGIDPFDQPNVEEAKELTRRVLSESDTAARGRQDTALNWSGARDVEIEQGESVPVLADADGLTLIGDAVMRLTADDGTVAGELARHLARRRPNAYLALQAFIAPTPGRDEALARIRRLLRDRTMRATTAGYGPRFLHSTGQLHKGGPQTGWFIQLTAEHPVDRPIPDWPYTFGQLIDAQAEGDFGAIEAHDLPILRVHLGADVDAGLAALERALEEALSTPAQEN
jgi:transaldolase/glucose-6-phosphate isomerase